MQKPVDVVVIGAGLAGLVAAREVRRAGRAVSVLEARDRVGGRLLNAELEHGGVVELGGEWVGPAQHRVRVLITELGLQTFPTYAQGYNVLDWHGRLIRYKGTIPRVSPAVLLDIAQAHLRIDRMARRVPVDAPWRASKAAEWDGQTFRSWLTRNTLTRGARELLEVVVEAVWAADASDVSLLHLLFYTHSAGNFDALIGTEGGAQQDRIVGGSQLLALLIGEALGEAVRLNRVVRRIVHDHEGVEVVADGETVRGRAAIIALPPALCGRIDYRPALPALRDQLTQRIPQGTVIKCMAVYERPFWRDDGLSGQATSVIGPVKVMFDNTPHGEGRPGVLLAFLEGAQARRLGEWEATKRRAVVLGCLRRVFGERAGEPLDYLEMVWAAEEYTRGCYGCYMPPGGWTAYGPALRAPVGAIHWAGSETATTWSGYMDGAVQSGQRAAEEVLRELEGD